MILVVLKIALILKQLDAMVSNISRRIRSFMIVFIISLSATCWLSQHKFGSGSTFIV